MGHTGEGGNGEQPENRTPPVPANVPAAAINPIGGETVRTVEALSSGYQGMIYYFASKENRDRFAAAPHEHAHNATGHPVRPVDAANEGPRRRREA